MKRELKLNFGELRLVEERVAEFEGALADIDLVAAYFDDKLGEQESDAVKALMEYYQKMKKNILYFQDILSQLKTLLGNYISDMENHIMPKDENAIMLVDRNDIWWNMKQIEANIGFAGNVASGRELSYYRDIDTTPSPPHIYEGMSPEAESAAWEGYRQNLQESQNRKANYNKLLNFCNGTARSTKNSLDEFYDSLEVLYKKHVVEFENTDDDYTAKAKEVYDACTSFGERFFDNVERKVNFHLDIHKGIGRALIDFVSGVLGLAFTLLKITGALSVAVVTVPFGITPQWIKDTGKEAVEGVQNIVQILKNPGRALAAIGQRTADTVEEKGIPYAVSYVAADIAIGILVDKGIGKLKALAKGDDVAKLSTKADDVVNMADDFKAGVNAVEKMDAAAGIADDVAAIGNIEGGSKTIDDIIDSLPETTNGKDVARNFESTGGFDHTIKDFDSLNPIDVKEIQTQYGLGKVGKLSDGTTVVARPGSTTGGATLEIRVSNSKVYKIRY